MDAYEVVTLLSVKDEATVALQRFVAMLREVQAQVDASLAGLQSIRNALAPSNAALARQREAIAAQRESVGLVEREAQLRASMAVDATAQGEAMVAARRASLGIAREELGVQRSMRNAAVIPAFKRLGGNLFWGGAGVVGGLAYATQQAINFNQTALETDMALGGYTRSAGQRSADIEAIKRAAFAGSEATGFFNAQAILEGLKKAASAGARPLVERMGMGTFTAIAPALARYMDVLGRLKGESADSAAMQAIQTAHQFGAYTPTAINHILNAQAALALLMPDKMSAAVNTGAYVASTGINLAGMPQTAILALMATADQSGLGRGRAGARLKDYIEAIAVTQSKGREKAKSLLGIRGAIGAGGSLDLDKSFEILIGDSKRMGAQAFRDAVRTAFGAQGAVVAAMFGDPSKRSMYQANRGVIDQALDRGDLTTIQNIMKGGVAGQEALAWVRLQNDVVKFGQYGMPIALRFFDMINPKLKQFGDWMSQHPDDARRLFNDLIRLGEGMLALSAAFKVIVGLSGAIKIVQALGGAMRGMVGGISAVASAARGAGPALFSAAGGLRALMGAAGAFLASPLGKVISGAGVLLGTTSFEPQGDARKQLIGDYGYDYWRYLKGRHPGTNPYSFNRGDGDLTPQQWRSSQPSSMTQTNHITVNFPPGTPQDHAKAFVDLLRKGGAPVSRGNPSHPLKGAWQGFSR